MENQFSTAAVIENLVNATVSADATARDRHVYREALRNLVRLAKSEHMLELRASVDRMVKTEVEADVAISA